MLELLEGEVNTTTDLGKLGPEFPHLSATIMRETVHRMNDDVLFPEITHFGTPVQTMGILPMVDGMGNRVADDNDNFGRVFVPGELICLIETLLVALIGIAAAGIRNRVEEVNELILIARKREHSRHVAVSFFVVTDGDYRDFDTEDLREEFFDQSALIRPDLPTTRCHGAGKINDKYQLHPFAHSHTS